MIIKSEPVIVSKEVAVAVEEALEGMLKDKIIEYHMEAFPEWQGDLSPLNGISLDTLIRILYIGYEVEKTAHEKVKELYDNYGPDSRGHHEYEDQRVQQGIRMTLEILGMKVEGIEDDN